MVLVSVDICGWMSMLKFADSDQLNKVKEN